MQPPVKLTWRTLEIKPTQRLLIWMTAAGILLTSAGVLISGSLAVAVLCFGGMALFILVVRMLGLPIGYAELAAAAKASRDGQRDTEGAGR